MSHISGEPNSADRFHPVYDAVFRCPSCEFFASGPSLLEAHLLTHDAVPIEAVGAIPVPDAGLTIHKPMVCKYGCGKAFADRGDLLRHYITHRRQVLARPTQPEAPVEPAISADPAPANAPAIVRTCRLCDTQVSGKTLGEALKLLRDHHKVIHQKPLERLGTAIFGEEKP